MSDQNAMSDLERVVLKPLQETGPGFYAVCGALALVVLWGGYEYVLQLTQGLGVTGMGRPVYWGIYISNFIFFTGISMAGTLISAILRVTHAEWRRSITRMAEAITGFALALGGLQILIDMGRVDRVMNVLVYGRLQSPMLWDFTCIGAYFLSSLFYLYLPMIPDLALLRDKWTDAASWRRWLYRVLALGWRGSEEQSRRLEKLISLMAIVLIPTAALVHTVVSWLFGMTLEPMWHSTIFGPYFVVGAIFSGIALLFVFMTMIRRAWHLESYIGDKQYNYLGLLLLAMSAFWIYFTLAENLTTFYGAVTDELRVDQAKLLGAYHVLFWGMVFLNAVVPFTVLVWRRGRTPLGTTIVSICVVAGMWLERFLIVIPSLTLPRVTFEPGVYLPTSTEIAITLASFALLALLYLVFFKVFPVISMWEVESVPAAVEPAVRSETLPAPAE
ncbi:MAG: polysulfide reductase NrfD [Chloroflexi bacterium]|nr:polysulfide reductase NrfD [Chloroflexota bacterium]